MWQLVAKARIASGDVTAALGYTPANKNGETFTGQVNITDGTVATQHILQGYGWENGIQRWAWVMEASGGISLYSYDSSGNTPTGVVEFSSNVAGGSEYLKFRGYTVYHAGNAGNIVTKNQTVSTSAPSGTPGDGDTWLQYTP